VSSTVKSLDPTQVELEISITPEEFTAAQDAAFRALVRKAKIPGFRPGKVPRKIFENAYGTDGIVDRALDDLINREVSRRRRGARPASLSTRPTVELVPAEEGEPPRFKATVAVRPEFEPKDYTGVEITDVPETAGDEDVDRALEHDAQATRPPWSRSTVRLRLGDTATIDYEGKIDGVPFEGGAAQGQQTELLEERFIPGFATRHRRHDRRRDQGGRRDLSRPVPERRSGRQGGRVHDHRARRQGARAARARRRVRQARVAARRRWPTCKAEIERRLGRDGQKRAPADVDRTARQIVAANDFPLPQVLVEREIEALHRTSRGSTSARAGISWDDYLKAAARAEERAPPRAFARRRSAGSRRRS
jgi:FKBP-type peptidyl-prolyl cis-trans isomerase (trigger factor)